MPVNHLILPGETWKPIPDRIGYEVSDLGRVRTYWLRVGRSRNGGPGSHYILSDTPTLKVIQLDTKGRPFVVLGSKRGRSCRVARLVLEAFIGLCPPGMEACHGPNHDSTDNRLINLRWDTRSSNSTDRLANGTHPTAVLNESNIPIIWSRLMAGEIPADIARELNVSPATIYAIQHGRCWTHITKDLPGFKPLSILIREPIYPPVELLAVREEIWRSIPGWNHEASNLGRIASVRRGIRHLLKPRRSGNGRYNFVGLYQVGRKPVNRGIAPLVLTAFVCPRPEGTEACHNDGNSANNRLNNLRWDTPHQNNVDAIRHGTCANLKLTPDQVREIRSLIDVGMTRKALSERFGVSTTTIRNIHERKTWTHF